MLKSTHRMTLGFFATTIFINAWLLFWIQPLLAKMLLPYLGGSPSVWNTCMMFFQGMLLIGYLYAHLSAKLLSLKVQTIVHLGLLLVGLIFLPFAIDPNWMPNSQQPLTSLLTALAMIAALPLLAICAGSPLLQSWFFATDHPEGHDPYFLFVISNAGCLFVLLAFPLLLEPFMTLSGQNILWTIIFIALILLTILSTLPINFNKPLKAAAKTTSTLTSKVSNQDRLHWILLAFVPASLLLGVTTHITTDIASVPLLWIIPLVLYLLAFIIAFSRRSFIAQPVAQTMQLALLLPFVIFTLSSESFTKITAVLFFHLAIFAVTCLVLALELAKRRPHPNYLTEYYLWISLGGFLGGAFNTLIAPLIFTNITEYPMMIIAAILLIPPINLPRKKVFAGCILFVILYLIPMDQYTKETMYTVRNFFGTSKVLNVADEIHMLMHGTTIHGIQLTDLEKQKEILSYYYPLVDIFKQLHKGRKSLDVGLVGLGAGISACLAKQDDNFTFYEINPDVIKIAQNPKYFTFLKVCPINGNINVGDARLQLQKSANNNYDVLVLDAFSSDAIPVHLLTKEALKLYFNKLKNTGTILLHISNRHLDLKPVVSALAQDSKSAALFQLFSYPENGLIHSSIWVILTKNSKTAKHFSQKKDWKPLPSASRSDLWTDDYSNIIRVIRFF